MPSKPARKPKRDDPKQSKRFEQAAKEAGGTEDPKEFERAFKKLTASKRPRAD